MGTITLIADTWDNLPEVEFMIGMDAPNQGQTYTLHNVARGWRDQFQDRVCYRRSSNPSQQGSGLNNWSCVTNPISDPETASLS